MEPLSVTLYVVVVVLLIWPKCAR